MGHGYSDERDELLTDDPSSERKRARRAQNSRHDLDDDWDRADNTDVDEIRLARQWHHLRREQESGFE